MTLRIHRQFIATIAAASIVITGFSAAPARAGEEEIGAALAAILGLAIVGAVIKDKRDDRKARQQVHVPQPQVHQPRQQGQNHINRHQRHVQPKPLPHRVNRKLLPQRCLFNLRTDNGRYKEVFGQRCLNRHFQHVQHLPQQCGRRVWTDRGARYGYGARCLSKHGYQLARR